MDDWGFLTADGRVARLLRAADWAESLLGPPSRWPDLLRSTLATMLTSPQPMALCWGPDRVGFHNDAFEPLLGGGAEGALGGAFPDPWAQVAPAVERAYAGEGSRLEDVPFATHRRGAPEEAWGPFSFSPLRDAAGMVRGVICVAADRPARALAERHARAERDRLAAMFEQAPSPMAMLDGPGHRVVRANRAFRRLAGGRDVLGRAVDEALPEAAGQGFVAALDRVRASGEALAARDMAHATPRAPGGPPEGGRLDVLVQPIRDGAGRVAGLLVQGQDASAAHEAQEALRTLLEAMDEAVVILERRPGEAGAPRDYRCAMLNRAARAAFGLADADAEGRSARALRPQAEEEWYALLDAVLDRGEPRRVERRSARRALEVYLAPIGGRDARRILAVARDVTERRRAPGAPRDRQGRVAALRTAAVASRARTEAGLAGAQVRQSQRMEALGRLTGGVAHEFNNLLTPIVGALDLLQRRSLGGPREHRMIEGAMQSAERARVLVGRLLAFAGRQPLEVGPVDLAPLVEGLRHLVASTVGPQVRVGVHVGSDLPPMVADADRLEMAILALAANARDAMPGGGALTVSAAREEAGPGHPQGLPPGTYLRLRVEDTGRGLDGATEAGVMGPVPTRGVGRGAGPGLSMVHGLALQLGGALGLESEPGEGTRATLWLPAARRASSRPGRAGGPAPARAVGAALLVGDEPLVRETTADMLAELGYRVTPAASADEALRLVEGGLAPDLLVTDHLMPGMTGTDLALRLRGLCPGMPVLIVSGFAEAAGLSPDLPRLAKPVRRDELAASLERLRRA